MPTSTFSISLVAGLRTVPPVSNRSKVSFISL
jgi:hypothetical protein